MAEPFAIVGALRYDFAPYPVPVEVVTCRISISFNIYEFNLSLRIPMRAYGCREPIS